MGRSLITLLLILIFIREAYCQEDPILNPQNGMARITGKIREALNNTRKAFQRERGANQIAGDAVKATRALETKSLAGVGEAIEKVDKLTTEADNLVESHRKNLNNSITKIENRAEKLRKLGESTDVGLNPNEEQLMRTMTEEATRGDQAIKDLDARLKALTSKTPASNKPPTVKELEARLDELKKNPPKFSSEQVPKSTTVEAGSQKVRSSSKDGTTTQSPTQTSPSQSNSKKNLRHKVPLDDDSRKELIKKREELAEGIREKRKQLNKVKREVKKANQISDLNNQIKKAYSEQAQLKEQWGKAGTVPEKRQIFEAMRQKQGEIRKLNQNLIDASGLGEEQRPPSKSISGGKQVIAETRPRVPPVDPQAKSATESPNQPKEKAKGKSAELSQDSNIQLANKETAASERRQSIESIKKEEQDQSKISKIKDDFKKLQKKYWEQFQEKLKEFSKKNKKETERKEKPKPEANENARSLASEEKPPQTNSETTVTANRESQAVVNSTNAQETRSVTASDAAAPQNQPKEEAKGKSAELSQDSIIKVSNEGNSASASRKYAETIKNGGQEEGRISKLVNYINKNLEKFRKENKKADKEENVKTETKDNTQSVKHEEGLPEQNAPTPEELRPPPELNANEAHMSHAAAVSEGEPAALPQQLKQPDQAQLDPKIEHKLLLKSPEQLYPRIEGAHALPHVAPPPPAEIRTNLSPEDGLVQGLRESDKNIAKDLNALKTALEGGLPKPPGLASAAIAPAAPPPPKHVPPEGKVPPAPAPAKAPERPSITASGSRPKTAPAAAPRDSAQISAKSGSLPEPQPEREPNWFANRDGPPEERPKGVTLEESEAATLKKGETGGLMQRAMSCLSAGMFTLQIVGREESHHSLVTACLSACSNMANFDSDPPNCAESCSSAMPVNEKITPKDVPSPSPRPSSITPEILKEYQNSYLGARDALQAELILAELDLAAAYLCALACADPTSGSAMMCNAAVNADVVAQIGEQLRVVYDTGGNAHQALFAFTDNLGIPRCLVDPSAHCM